MSDQPHPIGSRTSAEQLWRESRLLRRANQLLEERVKSRTDALRLTNEQLEVEIVERIKIQRKLQDRIAFDQILTTISTQFIHLATDEIDEGINRALAKIAGFTHYDRSYIYLFEANGRHLKNTHHWSNPQLGASQQERLALSPALFQDWTPRLLRHQTIYIQNSAQVTQDPSCQNKILAQQGICSVLIIPLVYSKEVIGFFGLDSNRPSQPYQAEHIGPLKVMADIFANAIVRKQTESDLVKRSEELNLTNAKLARALRTKDEFLANMSHELRTPLNAILGKTETLMEGIHGPITERQAASLKVIEESGYHLLELINDILDLAKIEAGKITLDIHPIVVTHVCESSLQFVRQVAHKKEIRLHADVDPTLNTVEADERRLKQVLINLLSNALKFTPAGGEVGLKVVSDAAAETVQFQVWDNGIGISAKDMAHLFKPFVQLDSSLARSHEGTGLGLSLVFHLTAMHGGSVALESEVGVGSRFTITLPQRPFIHPHQSKELAEKERLTYGPLLRGAGSPTAPGHLILLVEDNEANLEILAAYLQVWGYRVVAARSGAEALALTREETPDLILLNMQLPEMDGLTAISELRQTHGLQQTPIITLTALAMQGDQERCLAAGANRYLSKPVLLHQLVTTINDLLAEQTPAQKEPHHG